MRVVNNAVLAFLMLTAVSCSQATQSRPMWVLLEQATGSRIASFMPRNEPYMESGPAIGSPVLSMKLNDGRAAFGIAVRGWREGDNARVVVFAVVPRPNATPVNVLDSENTNEVQIATYLLAPGQTRLIREMQTLGAAPYQLHYANLSPQS